MKKSTLSLALALFAVLSAPAFASSYDTASSFKKAQAEQTVAKKKAKKPGKAKKA